MGCTTCNKKKAASQAKGKARYSTIGKKSVMNHSKLGRVSVTAKGSGKYKYGRI